MHTIRITSIDVIIVGDNTRNRLQRTAVSSAIVQCFDFVVTIIGLGRVECPPDGRSPGCIVALLRYVDPVNAAGVFVVISPGRRAAAQALRLLFVLGVGC